MLRRLTPFFIFIASSAWFSWLISWRTMLDPDSFYHAKVALLLWQHGPLLSFPWLDLTTLGTHFADQHFLFHAIEAPFVALLGWQIGIRVTAVLLLALFITVLYLSLKRLSVSYPLVWTILAATTHPLIVRGLLGKATPLAITFFIAGLTAAWTKKWWWLFFISLLFALSHGGWVYLLGSIVLIQLGSAIYDRWVLNDSLSSVIPTKAEPIKNQAVAAVEESLSDSERDSSATLCSGRNDRWRRMMPMLVAIAGCATGLLLHPNAKNVISFLWIQVIKIGLGTPYDHVTLGREWLPAHPSAILASLGPWLILLLVGMVGIFFAARKPLDHDKARGVIAFALPVAVLVGLTLKSRRNVEYLAPALALWIPWIWSLIDIKKLRSVILTKAEPTKNKIVAAAEESLSESERDSSARPLFRFLSVRPSVRMTKGGTILAILFVILIGKNIWLARQDLHTVGYRDEAFEEIMAPVVTRAQPGDRLFHSDWDEFPKLFLMDDRLTFVAGLDPTFLYEASSTLSDIYRDATVPNKTQTLDQMWDVIHERLDARFIFIAKSDHTPLGELLKQDTRYTLLKETHDGITFEIVSK